MQKQQLMAEIRRLINDLSRRLRSSKAYPESKNILALSRLIGELNVMEGATKPPVKDREALKRRGWGGYEQAMGYTQPDQDLENEG